jgi:hypothetical protein
VRILPPFPQRFVVLKRQGAKTPRYNFYPQIARIYADVLSVRGFAPPKAVTTGFDPRKSAQSADNPDFLGVLAPWWFTILPAQLPHRNPA